MPKHQGLYILNHQFGLIYGPRQQTQIERLLTIPYPIMSAEEALAAPERLEFMDILMTGWIGPRLDADFLAAAPNLKAVFYAGGSVRSITTDAFWDRDIILCSGYGANGLPVAEFALSQILFSLKLGWQTTRYLKDNHCWYNRDQLNQMVPGAYGSTVGLVSMGMIARHLCRLLSHFDVNIIAYDPFMTPQQADSLNVTLYPLNEVFSRADVVSIHTPLLDETIGMITGDHIARMKPYATLINTARGRIIQQQQLISVLKNRTDLTAVLDVVYPEPPQPDDEIFQLNNVITTPHISGSMANECQRMADWLIEDLKRYLNHQPLQWQITRQMAAHMA